MSGTAQGNDLAFAEIVAMLGAWNLPHDEVEFILHGAVNELEIAPRAQLFAQNTPVDMVYYLRSGAIFQERITEDGQGNRRISLRREVRPGQLIGHYDLIYSQTYSTRARALESSSLISIEATALNRILYRFPNLRQRIVPRDKVGRLRTIPLFGHLDLTALSYVADACEHRRLAPGMTIYGSEDEADKIYIVDEGQVVLTWPDGHVPRDGVRDGIQLGNGMAFGFLNDPISNPPQTTTDPFGHSARTTTPTSLFSLSRTDAVEMADLGPEEEGYALYRACIETMNRATTFSRYSSAERQRLLGYTSHYHLPIHHLIMQQGETADSMWMLMPGSRATLRALHGSQALQPTPVQGPNFFSELALRVQHPVDSTVEAAPNSQWLRLHNDDFQTFLEAERERTGEDLLERLTMSPSAERFLGRTQERQRYAWLQSGEQLVLFQRRHWLVLLRKAGLGVVIFAVAAGLSSIVWGQPWTLPWLPWVLTIVALLAGAQFLWGVADYLNDYLLITNQRLVRQEKVLFLAEWRQAAFLEQIRNVDVQTTLIGNIFQYGELRVQTAATSGSIAFDFVPDPHHVRSTLLEQQSLRQQHYSASSKMVIQGLLEERLGLRLRMPPRVCETTDGNQDALPLSWWQRAWSLFNADWKVQRQLADRIIWRKHWFVLIGKIIGPFLGLLFCLVLLIGQQFLPDALRQVALAFDIIIALAGIVLTATIAWLIADWRNDTYEVDNRQIADVEKKPLFFAENRRTALLGEIENIEVRIPSPLHYLLNFGNVMLQTAAAEGDFTFDWVPDPRGVSEEIRRRIEQYRQMLETDRARQRAEELPDWFEMYNHLESDSTYRSAQYGRP